MIIPRLQLFEFCDQPWIKGWLREGYMDCLASIHRTIKPYESFLQDLLHYSAKYHIRKFYDLGTGGGESIEFFLDHLKNEQPENTLKIIGTDLFPDQNSLRRAKEKYPHFDYIPESVNALDLSLDKNSSCLMFSAFHHFKPEDAARLIRSCLINDSDLIIFEFTSRKKFLHYATMMITMPLLMLVPFHTKNPGWLKSIFTLLIPIIPIMVNFDGFISNLRTYTETELCELAKKAIPDKKVNVEYKEKKYAGVLKSYYCRFYIDPL